MKLRLLVIVALVTMLPLASLAQENMRFLSVDIYMESAEPFAAWQFELSDKANAAMRVVGVENGASRAFDRAPYYDREAVQSGTADRIIVADYSLADVAVLPVGRVRLATVHLMISGVNDPDFDLRLVAAVSADGSAADAAISFELPAGSEQ